MATIVGVRFKNAGKLYYFDPGSLWPVPGNYVIVETARGMEYGLVITGVREVSDEMIAPPLKPILRIANERDAHHAEENERYEKEAYQICQRKTALLLYGQRTRGFPLAREGLGQCVSHAHRAKADRRTRRSKNAWRTRPLRQAHLLRFFSG